MIVSMPIIAKQILRIQLVLLFCLGWMLAQPGSAAAQEPPPEPPPGGDPGADPAPDPQPPPPPEGDPEGQPGPGMTPPPGEGPGMAPPPGEGPGTAPPPLPQTRRRKKSRKRTANNILYVEGGGPGGGYSVGYERMLPLDFAVRAGVSYLYVSVITGIAKAHVLFVPIVASWNGAGKGSHALELAVGGTIIYCNASAGIGPITLISKKGTSGVANFSIGYRFQPRSGGIQFRFGFTGMFGPGFGLGIDEEGERKWRFLPWAYASVGWTFWK